MHHPTLQRLTTASVLACALLLPGQQPHADAKGAGNLDSSSAVEVFDAIQQIAERKQHAKAMTLLERALDFDDAHLAVASGECLSRLDADTLRAELLTQKPFNKWLKRALKQKEPRSLQNLARILCLWGAPELDEAIAKLCAGRRTPEVQAEALHLASNLRPSETRAYPKTKQAILDALKKGRTEGILCAAADAAATWADPDFTPALVSMVKKRRDKYTGLYGVWALRQIGWDQGIDSFLFVATKNPKRTTLNANLKAITELAATRDVDTLLSMSRSPKKDLRDAAVLALGRLPWRSTRGRLPEERPSAKAAVTGDVEKKVKKELPEPELKVPDKVIDRLIQLVQEARAFEVRDAARQGLLRFGKRAQEKVCKAMPGLVTSHHADVAQTAIELCGRFGAKDAYADLLKTALHETGDPARRMFASRALEGIDPARAAKDLSAHIRPRPKPKGVELRAVEALGYLRHRAAFDAVLDMLTSVQPYSEAMLAAGEIALERQTGHRLGRVRDPWIAWIDRATHPFHPMITQFDRAANRSSEDARKLYGLTTATERAVEDGLRWLARQQHTLGIWDGNEHGGTVGCEPAYTGLCLLAMLGAGYRGDRGKYRELIRRGSVFLAASQFYDGGYPVTGGGDDSWIFAYMIGMSVWAMNESYGLSGDERLMEPAQWGIDYLVRVQTPGGGWRYGARYIQSDTSCTSWVLMATKMADLIGLDVAQKSWDGVDAWLYKCSTDVTGEVEQLEDLRSDYESEMGLKRHFEAFSSYFPLSKDDGRGLRRVSMTAVTMTCRFFMGWKRSHPYMIGASNLLSQFLPDWMNGLAREQSVTWYHYYWYYGALSMHQMGGRTWGKWNQKMKKMYPAKQRRSPEALVGSWDPDTAVHNGGRLFSTVLSIMSLETYYRFDPLLGEKGSDTEAAGADAGAPPKK